MIRGDDEATFSCRGSIWKTEVCVKQEIDSHFEPSVDRGQAWAAIEPMI
jgi:hypothetical protein